MLRTATVTRYVSPLREGGSLPGLVEADAEAAGAVDPAEALRRLFVEQVGS